MEERGRYKFTVRSVATAVAISSSDWRLLFEAGATAERDDVAVSRAVVISEKNGDSSLSVAPGPSAAVRSKARISSELRREGKVM